MIHVVCDPPLTEDEQAVIEAFVEDVFRARQVHDGLSFAESMTVEAIRAARGRPVSRVALCLATCRRSYDPPHESVAAVRVCNIRRKRPDLGAQIETVRDLGFRWKEG